MACMPRGGSLFYIHYILLSVYFLQFPAERLATQVDGYYLSVTVAKDVSSFFFCLVST